MYSVYKRHTLNTEIQIGSKKKDGRRYTMQTITTTTTTWNSVYIRQTISQDKGQEGFGGEEGHFMIIGLIFQDDLRTTNVHIINKQK